MPYEDEEPPYVERPRLDPDPALDDLTGAIIGAAIEVHRQLGPGLDEALYKAGMCVELRLRSIPFACEVTVPVFYKGEAIGKKRLDLVVGNRIIVELKAVECLTALHKAQLHTYLKIMNYRLGLLINFNCPVLKDGIKRVINPAAS